MDGVSAFFFEELDSLRRRLGDVMDLVGFGHDGTPYRTVFSGPGVKLLRYGTDSSSEPGPSGPVLLIVAAPIKRSYIWDLAPWASVVRRCLEGRIRLYLIHWERPGDAARGFGLADYADRLIFNCMDAIRGQVGEIPVFVAGHSLGGTLATFFAAMYPEWVRGLILLGAPLHFGPEAGRISHLVAAAPPAQCLTAMLGNVPGSVLNGFAFAADPLMFGWARGTDWLCSLTDWRDIQTYLRVERWALDEVPMAQQLFEEVVEWLYREDRFIRETLMIGEKQALPKLVQAPLLSVVDPRCRLVPPAAVLPFHRAAGSGETRLLWYEGDVGVCLQHLGMLVGRRAHEELWPAIIRWIHDHHKDQ